MENVLREDQYTRPAEVGTFKEFVLSGRLGASSSQASLPIKKKKQSKQEKEADKAKKLVKEAEKAISFIEYLK